MFIWMNYTNCQFIRWLYYAGTFLNVFIDLDAYSQKLYKNVFTKVFKIVRNEFHKNFLRFSKRIFKIILPYNVLQIPILLNFHGIKKVVKE
jgi:hypothetical protein